MPRPVSPVEAAPYALRSWVPLKPWITYGRTEPYAGGVPVACVEPKWWENGGELTKALPGPGRMSLGVGRPGRTLLGAVLSPVTLSTSSARCAGTVTSPAGAR